MKNICLSSTASISIYATLGILCTIIGDAGAAGSTCFNPDKFAPSSDALRSYCVPVYISLDMTYGWCSVRATVLSPAGTLDVFNCTDSLCGVYFDGRVGANSVNMEYIDCNGQVIATESSRIEEPNANVQYSIKLN
jgi:hypothetical protein